MKKRGITLIELIAVMAMMGIIGLGIMSLFLSQNRLFTSVNNDTIIQDEARFTLTTMEEDFRLGRNSVVPNPAIATTTISIGAKTYTVPAVNGVQGVVLCGFTKKDVNASPMIDKDYAYILYDKTLIRANGITSGGTDNMVIGATMSKHINSISVTQEIAPDVKYNIEMELQKGTEKDTFSSVVVKR